MFSQRGHWRCWNFHRAFPRTCRTHARGKLCKRILGDLEGNHFAELKDSWHVSWAHRCADRLVFLKWSKINQIWCQSTYSRLLVIELTLIISKWFIIFCLAHAQLFFRFVDFCIMSRWQRRYMCSQDTRSGIWEH